MAAGTLVFVLLGASAVVPQSAIVLSSLGVDVWPDYDRPGVLVIYRATIAPEITLPTRLVFRIPAGAGMPSAVAERPADGQLMTLPYVRTVDGETALIDLTATQPLVQLEYYDPAITRDGVRRSFTFTWFGDFEVRDFDVSLQQPHLAENFSTIPEAPSSATSLDGLVYHTLSRAGVARGELVEIQASYEKASDQLSVATLAPVTPPPAAAVLTPTPVTLGTETSDSGTGRVVLVALFVTAAAVVVGLIFRGRRQAEVAPHPSPPSGAVGLRTSPEAGTRFCQQCGGRVDVGDEFCRRCGTRLKT